MVSLARQAAPSERRGHHRRMWLMAGLFAGSAVAIVDAIRDHDVLLTGVLIAPLVAALGATVIEVAITGVYALALAFALGEVNHIFLTSEHIVRVVVVAVAS